MGTKYDTIYTNMGGVEERKTTLYTINADPDYCIKLG